MENLKSELSLVLGETVGRLETISEQPPTRLYALYFSRATIPWDRERYAASREEIGDTLLRHIGIYAYRAGFIRRYVAWAPCPLERIELLEQLRVLWYGEKIHVAVAETVPGVGVDTPEDLARVRAALQG